MNSSVWMKALISSLKCATSNSIKRRTAVRMAWRRATRTALILWSRSHVLRHKQACPSRLSQSKSIRAHFNQLAMHRKTMNTKLTPAARSSRDQQWLRACLTLCREPSRSRTTTTVRTRPRSSRLLSLHCTSSNSTPYHLRRRRRRLKPSPTNLKRQPRFCSKGKRHPSMTCFFRSSKPWIMKTRRARTTTALLKC